MRMTAAKMHEIEKASKKLSITKLVEKFMITEKYSYSEKMSICRNAIIKAIKWSRNRKAHLARTGG